MIRDNVRVTTGAESAAVDAAAMAAGIPSRALMQRAAAAAASEIAARHADQMRHGVRIYAGPGNNGGDGWVVARALAAAGVRVNVVPCGESTTDDARAERRLAEPLIQIGPRDGAALVIDALLGTGARGAPRGEIAEAIRRINAAHDNGATTIALDVPSGIDATTGAAELAVRADLTLTFGTMKRGLLMARSLAGRVAVLDIGLLGAAEDDATPVLADATWVESRVPTWSPEAHKGTRKRLVIVGGAPGMVGAATFAARAAMRSGIGMVRLMVAPVNVRIAQATVPHAMAGEWPTPAEESAERDAPLKSWADVVLIGPGLGNTTDSRALVEHVLTLWRGPAVLDADALNVFQGDAPALAALLAGRSALITPHVAEFARLAGTTTEAVLASRFDIGASLARTLGAAVLLKGVPTVVTSMAGARVVSASGTPALAAAGSGDLLGGIAATLLAQTGDALAAGACAAWVHGRAAELAGAGRTLRGVTLDDVEGALGHAWSSRDGARRYPVLAELPPIGDDA